jgi:CubicO group peptidase (beta-lactamase class C family)
MKSLIISIISILVFIPDVFAQSQSDKIDNILSSYYGENTPSIGVMVLKNNEVVANKVYGYAHLKNEEKATFQTNYNLGTLSEQFVVATALLLEEQGRLDVKSRLSDHFQGVPDYCEQVKVSNLLNHNSGLPLLPRRKLTKEIKNKKDLIEFLKEKDELLYKTGKKSVWNALNYGLLAAIVNEKLETPFHKYIKRNIFKPLGMDNSKVYRDGWFFSISDKAPGYQRLEGGKYKDVELDNEDYIPGTNGIYSNLNDMKKWLIAWNTDTLLSDKSLNKVSKINFVRGQSEFPGYGWKRGFNKGRKYFYAGGISKGNTHILLRFPSAHVDVVILSNQSSLFNLRENAFKLLNLFTEKEYEVK